VNCQREAKYADKLNKTIIPLIMQKNVKGWLGMLMPSKIFVNFTKYKLEKCIERLIKKLNGSEKKESAAPETSKLNAKTIEEQSINVIPVKISKINSEKNPLRIKEWSEQQLKDWFNSIP
jgi:hypothetical protein